MWVVKDYGLTVDDVRALEAERVLLYEDEEAAEAARAAQMNRGGLDDGDAWE